MGFSHRSRFVNTDVLAAIHALRLVPFALTQPQSVFMRRLLIAHSGMATVIGTSSLGIEAREVSTVTLPFVNARGNSSNLRTRSKVLPGSFGTICTFSPGMLLVAFFSSTTFPRTDFNAIMRVRDSAG